MDAIFDDAVLGCIGCHDALFGHCGSQRMTDDLMF